MAVKSCRDCPAYLTDESEQRTRFGKAVGAPMCGTHGYVLGRPGSDNEQAAIKFASKCEEYGMGLPATPVKIIPRMTKPDVDLLAKGETGKECKTCTGCSNMLTSEATADTFGWPVNLCKAKGLAIFKPLRDAKGCEYAEPGPPTDDPTGLEIIDEFDRHYRVEDSMVLTSLVPGGVDAVEPSTQPTEAPVSDEDKGTIRAWFKVHNPFNGRDYHLPIFEPEFFSDEERALIPQTGDDEHPELYVDHVNLLLTFAVDSWSLDETLCLVGAPGNGKTEFGRYLAWRMQVPFRRLSLTENTDPEDFLGAQAYEPSIGTYFSPGRLPQAWQSVGVLVSDEYNVAPDSILQTYRPLTDNSKQLVIEDKIFERNAYCFHLLTMNPDWDARNIGTRPMGDADGNRLSFAWVPEPPEPVMRHILRERCAADGFKISNDNLELIVRIGKDIREFSEQGIFPGSWGIRQEVKVARKLAHYDLTLAYQRAVLDSVDPETAKLVQQAIDSHVDPNTSTSVPF